LSFGLGKRPVHHTAHPWLGAALSTKTLGVEKTHEPHRMLCSESGPTRELFPLCPPENHTDAYLPPYAVFEFFQCNPYVFQVAKFNCVPKFLFNAEGQGSDASFSESYDPLAGLVAENPPQQPFQYHQEG
jgi:hypothetical protein